MAIRWVGFTAIAVLLGGCTSTPSYSFPVPGSYDPLQTTHPVDPGAVAVGKELDKVERSIEDGRDSGQLSRKHARALRKANRALASSADLLGSDGLTASEQRDLENQARILDSQVQAQKFTGPKSKPD